MMIYPLAGRPQPHMTQMRWLCAHRNTDVHKAERSRDPLSSNKLPQASLMEPTTCPEISKYNRTIGHKVERDEECLITRLIMNREMIDCDDLGIYPKHGR